ncbi:MAG: HEAT repeat domain-containing protein [Acidimicrobiia bacterium]
MDDATSDECRREIAVRGLTPDAVAHLTRDALGRIDLDALAPVKRLLKQFFSDAPWTDRDDDALAALVGPGNGWWEYDLDGFELAFGWRGGAFRLDLTRTGDTGLPSDAGAMSRSPSMLEETFEGAVVPEATPNPRTIRFITGELHRGPSRWYESAAQVDDPRVARLFAELADVANVLVGPDFVAVGIHRPDRWEQLLGPVLRIIEAEFPVGSAGGDDADVADDVVERPPVDVRGTSAPSRGSALDRAWRELRSLKPDQREDKERLLGAASSQDVATRQVAARVLIDADADTAARVWSDLLDDSSRTVRRATVDALVDAERQSLRPLLERALGDSDAWTRWKALRGLVELGIEPSRDALTQLAADPDFRVRLEAASALRGHTRYAAARLELRELL